MGATAEARIQTEQCSCEQPKRRARVLVIDDEEFICHSYRRVLEPDHEVVLAVGGPEALELLARDQNFDIVICDLMMPKVDGPAVYEFLRQQHSPLLPQHFVFVSGGALSTPARSFVASVHSVCFDKPLNRDLLLNIVAQVAAVRAHA
jgi:CheY-like chemotaxis protein